MTNKNEPLTAKRILCYLQATKDFGIFYRKGEISDLSDFTYNNYAGNQDDRKITSCYILILGTRLCRGPPKSKQFSHYQVQ